VKSGLELYDSRVSRIEIADGLAVVYFSHGYIRKPGRGGGTGWSQELRLIFSAATISEPLAPLPNTIADGYLEVGGIRHEIIPLPFRRKVGARLYLAFFDGTRIEIAGEKPFVELLGTPIFLEAFP